MTHIPRKGCALITGGGGRLGTLLRAARDRRTDLQHSFIVQSRAPGADVQWAPGDSVDALPQCHGLIALWGATSGTAAELATNRDLVSQSARLARELGATHVVHLSSAAVYGAGHNMNEDHSVNTSSEYGKSKIDMETAVTRQRRQDGLCHICLRLANVVGADSLAPALRNPGPATIDNFASGVAAPQGPRRSYISASDLLSVLDGLLALPAQDCPETLNVACPKPVAMDALVRAVDKDVIWRPAPRTATADVTLDVSRLQALLPTLTFRTTAPALIADWRRLESRE